MQPLVFSLFIYTFIINIVMAENYKPKTAINGSGLVIPRMVSLNKSLVFMRSGPGYKYPVLFEFKKKKYPVKVIAEFNIWRKVSTFNNITGWVHTKLLSSFRTGIILKTTILRKNPSNQSTHIATLLPKLVVEINKCNILL